MVGQAGILDAAICAVETVEASFEHVVNALASVGGQMLITSGHRNFEQMVDKEIGTSHTTHTINEVSMVYLGGNKTLDAGGSLSNLAPTVLSMLRIDLSVEMTGRSLIKFV